MSPKGNPGMAAIMAENESFYRAAEKRVEYLTLAAGLAAALFSAWRWTWAHALGVLLGAVLSWLNYRWMKQGVDMMARLGAAQAEAEKIRVPRRVYVKFFARYALIAIALYVIFTRSLLPAAAVLCGLFAMVAAVILEILYELVRGLVEPEPR